jgi:ubiquinone/menaquinone biosynthesis C-methylase UbiE
MTLFDDASKIQYQTSTNLNTRIFLHERFGVHPQRWQEWVFEQLLVLPDCCHILEVGSGPGTLWSSNRDRIPLGWEIMITDISEGMVASARQSLEMVSPSIAFAVADVLELPFPENTFDAVIANYMLFHIKSRPAGLAEISRVLKPDGMLFAATNGVHHLSELVTLVNEFGPNLQYPEMENPFSLENGFFQLAPFFIDIALQHYHNDLAVTEVEPIIDYLQSTMGEFNTLITGEQLDAFRAHVEKAIRSGNGAYRITRDTGMFIAHKELRERKSTS